MNPADSFIIKQANRNRSLLRRTAARMLWLFLLLLDFLDPLLMVFLLRVILGLLPGQLQHGCLLGKRRVWLGFMQTICQHGAAMRQRVGCKMIQRLLYGAVGKRKEVELKGSLRYIKVMFITSEHQIQHAKPQSHPPSRGNKGKKLLGHLPPSGEREEQQQTTTAPVITRPHKLIW